MKDWLKANVTGGVIATLVAGSLAAAVFSWWVNRPTPTMLAYVLTTNTTGADSTAKSLVPGLSLRIGDEQIGSIHTHVLEVYVRGAYLERAPLAVAFSGSVRQFGKSLEAPGVLETI